MTDYSSQDPIDYGTPFKHTDGKWYYPEYESNGEGGYDRFTAIQIDDEGYIAYLERTLLNEIRLKEVIRKADQSLRRAA